MDDSNVKGTGKQAFWEIPAESRRIVQSAGDWENGSRKHRVLRITTLTCGTFRLIPIIFVYIKNIRSIPLKFQTAECYSGAALPFENDHVQGAGSVDPG